LVTRVSKADIQKCWDARIEMSENCEKDGIIEHVRKTRSTERCRCLQYSFVISCRVIANCIRKSQAWWVIRVVASRVLDGDVFASGATKPCDRHWFQRCIRARK